MLQSEPEALRLMRLKHIDKNNPIYKKYINDVQIKGAELQEELSMKRNRIFTACFSENRHSLLMWSHYANSHKGFCIEYHLCDILSMFGIDICPVIYSNDFPKINTYEEFLDHHEIV